MWLVGWLEWVKGMANYPSLEICKVSVATAEKVSARWRADKNLGGFMKRSMTFICHREQNKHL